MRVDRRAPLIEATRTSARDGCQLRRRIDGASSLIGPIAFVFVLVSLIRLASFSRNPRAGLESRRRRRLSRRRSLRPRHCSGRLLRARQLINSRVAHQTSGPCRAAALRLCERQLANEPMLLLLLLGPGERFWSAAARVEFVEMKLRSFALLNRSQPRNNRDLSGAHNLAWAQRDRAAKWGRCSGKSGGGATTAKRDVCQRPHHQRTRARERERS